jgi:hypothetical protein
MENIETPKVYLKYYLRKNPLFEKDYTKDELIALVETEYANERERYSHDSQKTYLHTKDELWDMNKTFIAEFSQYPFSLERTAIMASKEAKIMERVEKSEGFVRWVDKDDFDVASA